METKDARLACENVADLIGAAVERVRAGDDLYLTLVAFGIGAFDRGNHFAHEKDTIPDTRPVRRLGFKSYADMVNESGVHPAAPPTGAFAQQPTKPIARPAGTAPRRRTR